MNSFLEMSKEDLELEQNNNFVEVKKGVGAFGDFEELENIEEEEEAEHNG